MKERKSINSQVRDHDPQQAGSDGPTRTPMTPRRTSGRLGRDVQIRIGQQLRVMYDEVVNEGVPDHIADLVRRLTEHDDEGSRE